jgi:phosphotransferase system enzyme I (PtsI)
LARSLGIPAVLGVKEITGAVQNGDLLVLDGTDGLIIVRPSEELLEEYRRKQQTYTLQSSRLKELAQLPAITRDGLRTVTLCGNISGVRDCSLSVQNGAEGVGLFRTEFLYMDRESLPGEEEQFAVYRDVLKTAAPHPVIIRTLDIGGDKRLPYLHTDEEMNPFLGVRAIRFSFENPDIFKTQLRAILRASSYGKARVMYPMIACLRELRKAKDFLEAAMRELDAEGIPYDRNIEIGIMIEVPAAAVAADRLASEVDFFSIVSNDLIQYTLAADRLNRKLSDLYTPLHPSVLRLIKNVIDAAHKVGKWTGLCGEMAGDEQYAALLLGMGLDEFSMNANALPQVKRVIRGLDYAVAQQLAETALDSDDADDVAGLLEKFR